MQFVEMVLSKAMKNVTLAPLVSEMKIIVVHLLVPYDSVPSAVTPINFVAKIANQPRPTRFVGANKKCRKVPPALVRPIAME